METEAILDRINQREKEIDNLNELIKQAEKENNERKVQRYNDEKIVLRQEVNTLLNKCYSHIVPVSEKIKHKYDDTLKNVLVEIGVRGVTNAATTIALGAGGIIIFGLTVRYYKNSLYGMTSSLWKIPQQYYQSTSTKVGNFWSSVNPVNSYNRWRATAAEAAKKSAESRNNPASTTTSQSTVSSWIPKIDSQQITNQIKATVNNSVPDFKNVSLPNINPSATISSITNSFITNPAKTPSNPTEAPKPNDLAVKRPEEIKKKEEEVKTTTSWSQPLSNAMKDPLNSVMSASSSVINSVSSALPTSWNTKTKNETKSVSKEDGNTQKENTMDSVKNAFNSSTETLKNVTSSTSSLFSSWSKDKKKTVTEKEKETKTNEK
eukprot:gene5221-5597_t